VDGIGVVSKIGTHCNFSVWEELEVSQPVFESVVVRRRDNGGRNLDTSIEPRTRPDAEGSGMEQEKVQSRVKRCRGYD
jgi:hypothetical protein